MKTVFELDSHKAALSKSRIKIIGKKPQHSPHVSIVLGHSADPYALESLFIKDKDLERFAVNVLKALNSKHLNTKCKTK